MSSGRDWSLAGAKATGQTVLARVGTSGGGNLSLISPQDESFYQAKEQSYGINVSIPIYGGGSAPPSLGLNASQLKLLAEYESIKQQSAIVAGTGGFDVRVNGHTHLKGGAVASKAASNFFETQTLTHEDVANRDVVNGSSWSVGLMVTGDAGKVPGTNLPLFPGSKPGMGGSAIGYARLNTNETFTTKSSIAGGVNLTRPDLQSARAYTMKALERSPLEAQIDSKQAQLDDLLNHEPPPCNGCAYSDPQSIPVAADELQAQPAGTSMTKLGGATGATNGLTKTGPIVGAQTAWNPYGYDPDWLAWQQAVQKLRDEVAALYGRIGVIDAKTYQERGSLSTSPSGLHQPLLHTFDKAKATQELRDGVAVTAAFGKAAYKAAGDYAKTQYDNIVLTQCGGKEDGCKAADPWRDGGLYRTALHAAIGGIAFGTPGATGNMAGSLALNAMDKVITSLGITDPTAINTLKNLAVTVAGAGVGGTAGAAAAFNADANNRQLHPDEGRYIKAKAKAWADRHPGMSLAEAEQQLTRGALYDNDLKWSQSLKDWTPEQVALYRQAGDFLRTEAAHDGFAFTALDGTTQAGFTSTPDQYKSSQYFLALALSDPNTRRLYSDRAALTLGAWEGAVFAGRALASAGVGLPEGVEAQLRAYLMAAKAAGDVNTYAKLVAAVADMQKQGFGNVLNRLFDSAMTQGQGAVYGVWLSWMQADSAALGHTAGKVLGAALVDYAAFASGVAVLNTAGRVVEGATVVQANLVRRIEEAKTVAVANERVLSNLAPDVRRVFNGVELSPKLLVDPTAGWDYVPNVLAGVRTENQYWAHWVGHQTEVRLASDLADQGQLVVRWGDKIGTNGADVISVNATTGQVTLWDTKFLSADRSIKMSGTFDFVAKPGQVDDLMIQAEAAVRAARLPAAVEAKAITDIQARNFFANTVGAGNAKNSVPMKFCGAKPC